MASKVVPNLLYLTVKGDIDFDTDVFKIILMKSGFAYNRATHINYADVAASELDTGNGYTQNTKVLTGIAIARNDTLYKAVITWSNATWAASGGPIGPTIGAFIINSTHVDDPLVQYIDFNSDGTEPDGGTLTIANPKLELTT